MTYSYRAWSVAQRLGDFAQITCAVDHLHPSSPACVNGELMISALSHALLVFCLSILLIGCARSIMWKDRGREMARMGPRQVHCCHSCSCSGKPKVSKLGTRVVQTAEPHTCMIDDAEFALNLPPAAKRISTLHPCSATCLAWWGNVARLCMHGTKEKLKPLAAK